MSVTTEVEQAPVAERLEALIGRWREETALLSSSTALTNHAAYRAIIALGWDAVPLLLRHLEQEPIHLFEALQAITGENPVPRNHWGNIQAMQTDWLVWGRERGLI